MGSVKAHGFLPNTVIVSDDAGQFNVGQHGLCWVHSERLVHKLDTFTDENRAAQSSPRADLAVLPRSQGLSWRSHQTAQGRLARQFDRIFTRKTGFVILDRLLARLHANKTELLIVLDRPEIPLHTNARRMTSAVTSPGARSAAAPAAMSAATAATHSSASPRLAPSSESRSVMTSLLPRRWTPASLLSSGPGASWSRKCWSRCCPANTIPTPPNLIFSTSPHKQN